MPKCSKIDIGKAICRPEWLTAFAASLVLLSCALISHAKDSQLGVLHQLWRSDTGLPGTAVFSVLQSRDGYLWVTTSEGISLFDGSKFVQVLNSPANGDESDTPLPLTQSSDGSIWGSTDSGLVRVLNGQTTHYTTRDGLPANRVLSVFQDRSGTLWIGCTNGLARMLADESIIASPQQIANLHSAVNAIVQDKSGTLWFGTADGLIELRNDTSTLHPRGGAGSANIRSLCASRAGGLWVGREDGLGYFRDGAWRDLPLLSALPQDFQVRALCEEPSGALWVGGARGVLRLEGSSISPPVGFGQSASEFAHVVTGAACSFCRDNEGDLWIGASTGLHRLRSPDYSLYDQAKGLPNNSTSSVLQTRDGSVWMGSHHGWLSRLQDGKITSWQPAASTIVSLCQDHNGTLWLGTEEEGLFGFPAGELPETNIQASTIHYSAGKNGLLDNNIRVIYEDHQGALWVGGNNWLYQLQNGEFTPYPGPRQIRVIAQDTSSNLWIGSHLELTCLSNGLMHSYAKLPGMARTGVNALLPEPDGALWIGCDSGDLLYYKNGAFKHCGLTPDLFDRILHLGKDDAGNLWIAARKGIFHVSAKQFDASAENRTNSANCIRLDGSQNGQVASFGQPCIEKTRDGRIWFAGVPGMLVVDPATLGPSSRPPSVVIDKVLFEDKPVSPGASVTKYNSRFSSLEIHYNALSLRMPGDLFFRCQLNGQQTWRDMGARRVVRYDNLPPGSYTFQVAARTGQGVWNPEIASFSFRLKPPFYRSYGFYVGALIILVATGFLAARVRMRFLRRREEELMILVEKRTHTLQQEIAERQRAQQALQESQHMVLRQERLAAVGQLAAGFAHEFNNILTVIQGHAALLQDSPNLSPDDAQSLDDICSGVDRSARLTRQMLAFSRKQVMQRRLIDLNESLQQVARMLDRVLGENITLRCDFAPSLPRIDADTTMLEQILMNLAVNARDAMPSGGSLTIATAAAVFTQADRSAHPERRAGSFLCFSVSDTGCGMDEKTLKHIFEPFFTTKEIGKGTGLGLATVYGFVSQHQGWIEVTSQPGKGTTFRAYFPTEQSPEPGIP